MKSSAMLLAIAAVGQAMAASEPAAIEIGAFRLKKAYTDDAHLQDIKAAHVDFILDRFERDSTIHDAFLRNGVGMWDDNNVPDWFGGHTNKNGRAAELWPEEKYAKDVVRRRIPHAALRNISMYDEPSALDFPHLAKLARVASENLPGVTLCGNLEPSTTLPVELYLGVTNYIAYIRAFERTSPFASISYDLYPYAFPGAFDWMFSRFYENFKIVSDSARNFGREFQYIPQVNSTRPSVEITENKLRYQANAALGYGVEKIIWACWGCGWWTNNVLTHAGTKTVQYERLKKVNAEIKAFSRECMRFRRTETYLSGFTGKAEKWIQGSKRSNMPQINFNVPGGVIDTGFFTGIRAEDGEALVVSEMASRRTADGERAIYVFAAEDPADTNGRVRRVVFGSELKGLRAVRSDGKSVEVVKTAPNRYAVELRSAQAVLVAAGADATKAEDFAVLDSGVSKADYARIVWERLRKSSAVRVRLNLASAPTADDEAWSRFNRTCLVLADACRNHGREFVIGGSAKATDLRLQSAALAYGAKLEGVSAAKDFAELAKTAGRFRRTWTECAHGASAVSIGSFTDVRAADGRSLVISCLAPDPGAEGMRCMAVFDAGRGRGATEVRFVSQLPGVRVVGPNGPLALKSLGPQLYAFELAGERTALVLANDFGCVGDGAGAGAGSLVLARRGEPADRSIVIARNAPPVARHAAEELRRYVEKLTGVSLPIADDAGAKPAKAIYLGSTRHHPLAAEGLGGDGFRFRAKGGDLLVSVGAAHGALFAVYDLLERYGGCEWLASGEDLVPEKSAFEVPDNLDDVQRPAFVQRDTNWRDVMYDPDFAAKMKLNGPHVKYGTKHGGRDLVLKPYLTFDRLLPASKHFDAHPEWYSEVHGRRVKNRTQLCLTNPEVLEEVAKRMFAEIEKGYPETKYYDLGQNDWQNWCTCAKCRELDEREGSHAATVLEFVNAVADRVARRWPDVVLRTLAYEYTRTAPKTVRARDNVLVTLCTDSCDCSKPMTANRNRENITFVSDLRKWKTLARRLAIWDYSANFRCFMHTFPNFGSMPRNIAWYADEGVTHIYFEGVSRAPHMADQEFRAWMISHLLWQPKQSAQALTERFLRAWYGDKAAVFAARHYEKLGNPPRDEAKNIIRMWGRTEDAAMPVSLFDWASRNWKCAEQAVKDDPVRLRRVRQAMDWADCSRILLSNEGATMDARSVADDANDERLADLRAAARRIVADFDAEKDMWNFGEEKGDVVMRLTRRLKYLAAGTPPANPICGRATIEESALTLSSGASVVDDPKAENGRALKVLPTAGGWAATFHFHDIRTDPAKKYRLRARIRIDRGDDPTGEAVRLGVYDGETQTYAFREWRPKAKELPAEYRWIDIGASWTPTPTTMLWFGNGDWKRAASAANPATKAVYLDRLEFVEWLTECDRF